MLVVDADCWKVRTDPVNLSSPKKAVKAVREQKTRPIRFSGVLKGLATFIPDFCLYVKGSSSDY